MPSVTVEEDTGQYLAIGNVPVNDEPIAERYLSETKRSHIESSTNAHIVLGMLVLVIQVLRT